VIDVARTRDIVENSSRARHFLLDIVRFSTVIYISYERGRLSPRVVMSGSWLKS